MTNSLKQLPLDERIRLVEDLWDSIAVDQSAIPLGPGQAAELDRRLEAYGTRGPTGRNAAEVVAEARKRL